MIFSLMAPVKIWPQCFNTVSMVPQIQHILQPWANMLLSVSWITTHDSRAQHVMGRLLK